MFFWFWRVFKAGSLLEGMWTLAVSWRTQFCALASWTNFFFLLEGTDVFLCIACSAMRALSVQKYFFFTFFGSWPTLFCIGGGPFLDGKSAHQNTNIQKRLKTYNVKNACQISAYRWVWCEDGSKSQTIVPQELLFWKFASFRGIDPNRNKNVWFFASEKWTKILRAQRCGRFFAGAPKPQNDDQKWAEKMHLAIAKRS